MERSIYEPKGYSLFPDQTGDQSFWFDNDKDRRECNQRLKTDFENYFQFEPREEFFPSLLIDRSWGTNLWWTDFFASDDQLNWPFRYEPAEERSHSNGKESFSFFSDQAYGFTRLQHLCRDFGPPKIPVVGVYDSDILLNRPDEEQFSGYLLYQEGTDLRLWSEERLSRFLGRQETTKHEAFIAVEGSGNPSKESNEVRLEEKRKEDGPPKIPVIDIYDCDIHLNRPEEERFSGYWLYQEGTDLHLWSEERLSKFLGQQETAKHEAFIATERSKNTGRESNEVERSKSTGKVINEVKLEEKRKEDEGRIRVGSWVKVEVDQKQKDDQKEVDEDQNGEMFTKIDPKAWDIGRFLKRQKGLLRKTKRRRSNRI